MQWTWITTRITTTSMMNDKEESEAPSINEAYKYLIVDDDGIEKTLNLFRGIYTWWSAKDCIDVFAEKGTSQYDIIEARYASHMWSMWSTFRCLAMGDDFGAACSFFTHCDKSEQKKMIDWYNKRIYEECERKGKVYFPPEKSITNLLNSRKE